MKTLQDQFRALRRAGVPLAAVETADPAQTVLACVNALNGRKGEITVVAWDCMSAFKGLNGPGEAWVARIPEDYRPALMNPSEALSYLRQNSQGVEVICFMHNAQRFLSDTTVMQGVWNLRDEFKSAHSLLVMLAPGLTLPSELTHDVVILSEPLPGEDELRKIAERVCEDAELAPEKRGDLGKAARTLRGLSAFAAEQSVALSITRDGIEHEDLEQRKRKTIEQTPGLAVWTGGETFDDLGGLGNLKTFLARVLTSAETPVQAIGFIDEIEKGLAGSAGDTSGTSQDQLQVFLKVMQDLNVPGMILLGHPGTGKSAIAKAAGRIADCPVVAIDTGAMKGSLVGESERKIRAAMEVFRAVSDGKGLFIATCNKIASLPPELRRRFTLGTFFVDLPTDDERAAIWRVWLGKYRLQEQDLPACADWTGAEIRACCDVAKRTGFSLVEAATYVTPIIRSAPAAVEELRKLANGRFLDASLPGVFEYPRKATATGRKLQLA